MSKKYIINFKFFLPQTIFQNIPVMITKSHYLLHPPHVKYVG